jgi:hypothetical protein
MRAQTIERKPRKINEYLIMLQVGFFETLFAARSRRAVKPPHQRQRLLSDLGGAHFRPSAYFFRQQNIPALLSDVANNFDRTWRISD